ncbi:hypothetical protein CPC08DRAFT_713314 [Agrocybe pediades]|nr:hypothetical protein CPC08DRAFT_713314 [Agrocybe pediades]
MLALPSTLFLSLLGLGQISSQIGFLSVNAYSIVKDHSGSTFFDGWEFYGNYDNLTSGDVNWLNQLDAFSKKLVLTNSAGNAILKVDNTTDTPYPEKRDSIRITSKAAYGVGTLWIADIVHLPFGCSVWPALWSMGPNWPHDGEIDIIEGINLMDHNQMALHTGPNCKHDPLPATAQKGKPLQTDCSVDAGCTVQETTPNSYGAGFNQAGGGVFATQFDAAGPDVPKSITAATGTSDISIDDWGVPSASYPSGASCDIGSAFGPQRIVLDITLCGVWAGNPQFYDPQCKDQGTFGLCYNDNVVGFGTAKKFDEAYFEMRYLRTYTNGTATITGSDAAGSSSAGGSSGSGTQTSGSNGANQIGEPSSATATFSLFLWKSAAAFAGIAFVSL